MDGRRVTKAPRTHGNRNVLYKTPHATISIFAHWRSLCTASGTAAIRTVRLACDLHSAKDSTTHKNLAHRQDLVGQSNIRLDPEQHILPRRACRHIIKKQVTLSNLSDLLTETRESGSQSSSQKRRELVIVGSLSIEPRCGRACTLYSGTLATYT
jgi:hypothetical protein